MIFGKTFVKSNLCYITNYFISKHKVHILQTLKKKYLKLIGQRLKSSSYAVFKKLAVILLEKLAECYNHSYEYNIKYLYI